RLLAIIRRLSLLRWGGGFLLFLRSFSFLASAALCETQEWGVWKGIFRRCLRRKLPSLPRPYPVFMKYSINEFGDEPFLNISMNIEKQIRE
ncbi:MAG: hypothetical protein NTY64_09425, partial [Deltaproteobacteria bacterium]|nr:hypothetical protein [Deltaproteobacteria bacterium]